jgi:replication factor A2
MTSLQKRTLDYYTEHGTSDEGCDVNNVAAGLGIELAQIKAAVDFLSSEGHLYSTIDDDHHKSTSE